MIRRPFNIIRRFSHSHKPNSEIDYASWYKSQDFNLKINDISNKINDISNKIDFIYAITRGTGIFISGSVIGAGIGFTIVNLMNVFK
jgi:hypothetical protein